MDSLLPKSPLPEGKHGPPARFLAPEKILMDNGESLPLTGPDEPLGGLPVREPFMALVLGGEDRLLTRTHLRGEKRTDVHSVEPDIIERAYMRSRPEAVRAKPGLLSALNFPPSTEESGKGKAGPAAAWGGQAHCH